MNTNTKYMENNYYETTEWKELNKSELHHNAVESDKKISVEYGQSVRTAPKNAGIELKKNKQSLLVERIKTAIYQLIYLSDELPKQNISDYISQKVSYNYTYLSKLFSRHTGISIKKYIEMHKIEYVKELLVYEELNLDDIARKMRYRNGTHLSNEFRKVTGVTPSFYRLLRKTSQTQSVNV